ncbi:MAG: 50S ribosomal protein L23, partial [Thermofilaceae archaeon]
SLMLAEKSNILTLIVAKEVNKNQIKEAVEKLFGVKAARVSTLITSTGDKKAYVKLKSEYNAVDVLSRMGVL